MQISLSKEQERLHAEAVELCRRHREVPRPLKSESQSLSAHDLTHQLSLPIEGQVTWLREPAAFYG